MNLKQESLFLGYSDIEGAVKEVKNNGNCTAAGLVEELKSRARTTSLEAYQSRFTREKHPLPFRETPIREFLCLLALYCEAYGDFPSLEDVKAGKVFELREGLSPAIKSVVSKCYSVIADELGSIEAAVAAVERHAGELNPQARHAVATVLNDCRRKGTIAELAGK